MSESAVTHRPRKYARRRATVLAGVYGLMSLHFAHWWFAGRTVAPLEVSETMHTLEMGVLTAGFLLMAVALLSVVIAGRFFCSWGCHILALEDLSAWILGKLGIKPKPVRSRLLLLVPPVAALYMFVWPQILRVMEGRPLPKLAIWSDSQGWASFVTENYWRSMPGPWVSVFTFLICGFAVVYFLGSRSFCTYACPYGAIFAVADRFAPGRIVAAGDCTQCGKCTAACQTHIRVHEELTQFGRIVNPSCLKAMDCIDACPTGSIAFGFAKPALFKSWRTLGRFGVPYDFTLAEEALLLGAFIAGFAAFRGLYEAVPFLLTLAIAGLLGFLVVTAARLIRLQNVRLIPFQLKIHGRLTGTGWAFQAICAAILLLTAHSGFIRYHEGAGKRALAALVEQSSHGEQPAPAAIQSATRHFQLCERYGLVLSPGLNRDLASIHLMQDDYTAAEPYVRRAVADLPEDAEWRIRLAALLLTKDQPDEALQQLRVVTDGQPGAKPAPAHLRASAHEMIAQIRIVQGDAPAAARELDAALLAFPASETARSMLTELLRAEPSLVAR